MYLHNNERSAVSVLAEIQCVLMLLTNITHFMIKRQPDDS